MVIKKKSVAAKEPSLIDLSQKPNVEEFMEEVRLLSSAAVGVVIIRTREFHRCATALFEFAIAKTDTEFRTWMLTDGWRTLPTTTSPTSSAMGGSWNNTATTFGNTEFGIVDPEDPVAPPEEDYICDLYPNASQFPNSVPDNNYDINMAMAAYFEYTAKDKEDNKSSVNVMFAADIGFHEPGFQEHLRRAVYQALDDDSRLYLIVHDSTEIPERIHEEVRIIDFRVPNAGELYTSIDEFLNAAEIESTKGDGAPIDIDLSEVDKYRIVSNGLGLSLSDFNTALSIAIVRQQEDISEGGDIDIDKIVATILDAKLDMLRKNPILEYKPAVPMSQVGGLGKLKDWMTLRRRAFSPEAAQFGVDKPKGVLAAGIPGSGKSLIAKAISSVLGIPCVLLDIGKVFGGLVGQSEGQMRSALALVEAMAPCVLLIDEVDKGFSNVSGGGDSGTSARVFGTFLTWLQERKNDARPVMVVFTANNVDHLPPELLRKGRVDELFCVSFPSKEERADIFKIHGAKRGHEFEDETLAAVLDATHEFVGAEIESIVSESILTAFNEGEKHVTSEILVRIASGVRPLSKTFPEKIKKMNEWARNNAVPASDSYNFTIDHEPRPAGRRPVGKRVIRSSKGNRN